MKIRINFAKRTTRLDLGIIHVGPIAAGVVVALATGCKDAGEPRPQPSSAQHHVIHNRGPSFRWQR